MKRERLLILLIVLIVLGCVMGYCSKELYRNYRLPEFVEDNVQNCGRGIENTCQNKVNPRYLKQYTYNEVPYFRKFPYFNYYDSPQIMGAGGRRIPLDTRRAIPNVLDPIDVSNNNIAPSSIYMYDRNRGEMLKVGVLTQIFGSENQVIPLIGIERQENKWEYFAELNGEYLPVLRPKKQFDAELATNDEVRITNICGIYRATMYSRYIPIYMPFY